VRLFLIKAEHTLGSYGFRLGVASSVRVFVGQGRAFIIFNIRRLPPLHRLSAADFVCDDLLVLGTYPNGMRWDLRRDDSVAGGSSELQVAARPVPPTARHALC